MKLFASDFDNTLHFRNENGGYFKPEDLEAIARFQKNGNFFGLCTGRPGNGFHGDLDGGPMMNFMIVSTGALIRDTEGKTLYEARIPVEDMQELDTLVGEDGHIFVHADGDVYTLREHRPAYDNQVVLQDVMELKDHHITGASVMTPTDATASVLVDHLTASFKADLVAFQNTNWLDIIQGGNSKGIAARKAKELFGADLLAGIGDSYNDMELLRKADVGFTFPYAPDALKAEADYIVNSVAEAIAIFEKM